MDSEKSFKNWYSTHGIRTPVPAGQHHHEFYQRIAYIAGAESAMSYCVAIIDKVEKELKKK